LINFYLLAAVCIAIAVHVLIVQFKKRREARDAAAITKAIVEYFRKSKVKASVTCMSIAGTKRFTAHIECGQMKRFRLSHIVESTLRDLVHNLHGLELDKVYWRLPINKETQTKEMSGDSAKKGDQAEESDDDCITEGLTHYRHLPKADVLETSWTTFKEASISNQEKIPFKNSRNI
jgi:hypothetical protein